MKFTVLMLVFILCLVDISIAGKNKKKKSLEETFIILKTTDGRTYKADIIGIGNSFFTFRLHHNENSPTEYDPHFLTAANHYCVDTSDIEWLTFINIPQRHFLPAAIVGGGAGVVALAYIIAYNHSNDPRDALSIGETGAVAAMFFGIGAALCIGLEMSYKNKFEVGRDMKYLKRLNDNWQQLISTQFTTAH